MMYIWLYTNFSVSSYLLETFSLLRKRKPSTKEGFFTYNNQRQKLVFKDSCFINLNTLSQSASLLWPVASGVFKAEWRLRCHLGPFMLYNLPTLACRHLQC